ncbi:hypothetical protein FRC08_012414 [Ceratobasidium sp. 394]|nr:hypothetical protein FRC08_012414 [Ceratobasidium sp. 394]
MRFIAINVVLGLISMVVGCIIPGTWDRPVARTMYSVTKARNASQRLTLALFETAWVESHVNNCKYYLQRIHRLCADFHRVNCSDRGTYGIFQRRCKPASLCLDVKRETNAFINKAIRVARPSMTPGQLAQAVQGGDARGYDAAEPKVRRIIAVAGAV